MFAINDFVAGYFLIGRVACGLVFSATRLWLPSPSPK